MSETHKSTSKPGQSRQAANREQMIRVDQAGEGLRDQRHQHREREHHDAEQDEERREEVLAAADPVGKEVGEGEPRDSADPILLEHRDAIYRDFLKLPLDF